MLPNLRETVDVIRPAMIRQRGDLVANWDGAAEYEQPGCLIRPMQGDETEIDNRRRNTVITRWMLSAPLDADLRATDRIRWRGQVYQVDGDPQPVSAQSPILEHLETQIYRVEG